MTTKDLASLLGKTDRTVQRWCKKAIEEGKKSIKTDSGVYDFCKTEEGYELTAFTSKRSTVSTSISWERLEELRGFDVLATRYSAEEKLLLVRFIAKYNYTMKTIIKGLLPGATSKEIARLTKRFDRWRKAYEAGGKTALEDRRGKHNQRFKKIDASLLRLAIEGAGARGIRDNYYGIWDFYCFLWQQEYSDTFDADNTSIISYAAISRAIHKLLSEDSLLKDYWTKGHDGINQSYLSGVKDITYPNQEWQVDATRFDFMVKSTDEDGKEKISRYNLTAVIDVYTGAATATLTRQIDSYAQVRVLYKAFAKMGIPEQIYMDNGRDYASEHYSGVLERMGIIGISAQVGQGRQKGKIERFFGTLQTKLAKLPGYIGNDVHNRTKIENQTASKIDIRTSKATRINPDRLMTLEEMSQIVDNMLSMLSQDYRAHDTQLVDAPALEEIRKKLGKSANRPLHQDGIKFNGLTYTSADLWIKGLGKGDRIDVYEDIDDINRLYVYHKGAYLCEAHNRELGVAIMSQEAFKEAKKANHANHIAPLLREIAQGKKHYEAYEDHNATKILQYTPSYIATPKAVNKKSIQPASAIPDVMTDIIRAAGY